MISIKGAVTYGTAGNQPTAVYVISGSAPNQVIMRTYTSSTGLVTTTTLTQTAADFQFCALDPANPGSTADFTFGGAGQPSIITAQVTFMPKFTRPGSPNARTGTTAAVTVTLREHS